MWTGHRALWRGSKTGLTSSPVETQSHSAAGRIPLRKLWEYVKSLDSDTNFGLSPDAMVGRVGFEPTVFLCHGFTDRFLRRTWIPTHMWRREWDSNPRYFAVHQISRLTPSTTRTSLQIGGGGGT